MVQSRAWTWQEIENLSGDRHGVVADMYALFLSLSLSLCVCQEITIQTVVTTVPMGKSQPANS